MSPMPIPALNNIANQDTIPNSGVSSSLPSLISPYRENANQPQKITKPNVIST